MERGAAQDSHPLIPPRGRKLAEAERRRESVGEEAASRVRRLETETFCLDLKGVAAAVRESVLRMFRRDNVF